MRWVPRRIMTSMGDKMGRLKAEASMSVGAAHVTLES